MNIVDQVFIGMKYVGVNINNLRIDKDEQCAYVYISVPNKSELYDDLGKEMCGMYLAKRIQQSIKESVPMIEGRSFKILAKVRNEMWTKEKAERERKNGEFISSLFN